MRAQALFACYLPENAWFPVVFELPQRDHSLLEPRMREKCCRTGKLHNNLFDGVFRHAIFRPRFPFFDPNWGARRRATDWGSVSVYLGPFYVPPPPACGVELFMIDGWLSVSTNVRRKPPCIARLADHHCTVAKLG